MKRINWRIIFGALAAVALLHVALFGSRTPITSAVAPSGYQLHSQTIFDTKEYPADGVVRTMTWTNTTGQRLLIRKAYLWAGMYHEGEADSDASVNTPDGTTLAKLQWDHYAEPTAPSGLTFNYEPGYIALEAGESLTLTYYTNPVFDQPPFMAAAQCILWWSTD